MSEMIGAHDPPWGALSPFTLRAAILGATASALGPTDGDFPGAAGARPSVNWSGPPRQMSELIGAHDPPWGALSPFTLRAGNTRRVGIRARAHRRGFPWSGWRSALGRLERAPQAE
jgi:hypothetical protein